MLNKESNNKSEEIKKFFDEMMQFESRLERMQVALRKMFMEGAMRRHSLDPSDLDAASILNDRLNKMCHLDEEQK